MKTPLKEVLAVNNITAIEMSLGIGKYDKYITKRLSKRSNLEFFEEDKVAIAGALGMRVAEIDFDKCPPTRNNFKKMNFVAGENIKLKKQLADMEAQLHEMKTLVRTQEWISADNERLKDAIYELQQAKNKLEHDSSIAAKEHSNTVYEFIKVKDELKRSNKLVEELQGRSFIKRVFKVGVK